MLETKDQSSKNNLGILVILAILFVRFFRTIVFGKAISKVFLLGHWDPCFATLRASQNFAIDGTLLLVQIPYRFFVAQCWRHGIPLWNGLSGFGMPLLADPQACVFSPIFALFYLFPTMYMWNQTIIIELAIAAIFTYLLCLELEFGIIAGLSAALLVIFCPWVQWQMEIIGTGICLTPFVFLFFVKAGKRNSIFHTLMAGVAAAIDILAGHPEMAFVTVVFATALMYAIAYRQSPVNFSFWKTSAGVVLAGLVAFGLTAIMLIPFKEYLANGYSYKMSGAAPANITWQALIANYFYPFHTEGSLFWGPFSWLGLAGLMFLSIKRIRFALCILIGLPLSVLAIAKLFPLSFLFTIFPFSCVESLYCVPEYVVFISILSGLGISSLITNSKDITRGKLFTLFTLAVIPIVVSALFFLWHPANSDIRTDQVSQFVHFNWKFWFINTACLASMLLAWLLIKHRRPRLNLAGLIGLVALAIWNLLFLSHNSLPIRPAFDYPKVLPLQTGTDSSSRFLTVGSRIFRHNTNLVYGLNNVQAYNPLLPKNFVEFMEACGAQTNDRFSQIFSAMISSNIDLTGTSTIISEQPLLDESTVIAQPAKGAIAYTNSLKLSNIKLFHDSKAGTIFCYLLANPNLSSNESCTLFLDIKEPDGTRHALGDPQSIAGWRLNQSLVFSGWPPGKNWTLSAKLLSDTDGRIIRPSHTTLGNIDSDGSWTVANANESKVFAQIMTGRFKPISSYHNITTYKNLSALNRYFFADNIVWVKNSQDTLGVIKNSGNTLRHVVALDEMQKKQFEDLLNKMQLSSTTGFASTGSIEKLTTASALSLEIETKTPALVVISDLYYPGWKAFLDNKEWPIFRADCLFRAVLIPAGTHQLSFSYQPLSFLIGAILFGITAIALSLFLLKHFRRDSAPAIHERIDRQP